MKSLKAQILALAVSTTQKVEINGLSEPIYAKKLSFGEYNDLSKQEAQCREKGDMTAAVHFMFFACNEKGEPIFGHDELDEIIKLPVHVIDAVTKVGYKLNQIDSVDSHEKN